MNATIKKYPIISYFVLTFFLTWGGMALIIGFDGFPISSEKIDELGPLVYMAMLIGPSVAGLLLTYSVDGGQGLREIGSRLRKWRVELRWYAVALLTAPLVAFVILLFLSLFSSEFSPGIFHEDNPIALALGWFVGGLMIAFFEELGWTGFAIPRMRKSSGVVVTGLIVGLLWGVWHFLPFWEEDSFAKTLPFALLLARLLAWLPPYRILMVWVYDRTTSLLVVILMHASLVATLQVIVPIDLEGSDLLTWLVAWALALWVIVTAVATQWHRTEVNIQKDTNVGALKGV